MIYAVWQTSDTPDTYYSCADVTFAAARKRPADAYSATPNAHGSTPGTQAPGISASPVAGTSAAKPARHTELLVAGCIAGLVLILTVSGAVAAIRRMRIRREL